MAFESDKTSNLGSRQAGPPATGEARAQLAEAQALRGQRRFDRAQSICAELVDRHPGFAAAHYLLGVIHADRGDYWRAAECLGRATQLDPRSWNALIALAGVHVRLEAFDKAAGALQQARTLKPDDPATVVRLGLARAYAIHGRHAEAAAIFESLWDEGQRIFAILTGLIELPASVVHKDILKELNNVERDPRQPQAEFDIDLAFLRAAALDKAGRYEEAWQHALVANRAIAARAGNEMAAEMARRRARLDSLRADTRPVAPAASDPAQPVSLFILGPSRCGKTTLEILLASLEGVRRGAEMPVLEFAVSRSVQEAGLANTYSLERVPPQIYPQLRAFYADELARRGGAARVFTSTYPGYMEQADRIAATIPNARFIFVKRNVEDNALRIFMRRYTRGNLHSYDLNATREYVQWYHEMIDALSARLSDIVRVIRYEDMVANPAEARRIAAELCDLPMTHRSLPVVADDRNCAAPYRKFMTPAAR